MKKYIYTFLTFVAVSLTFSCTKQNEVGFDSNQEDAVLQTYTCVFPGSESDTKVSLAADGKTGWEVGDVIFVHGQKGSKGVSVTLGVDEGSSVSADGKTATFTAAITDPNTYSSTIFVAYPASAIKTNWDTNPYLYWSNRFKDTNVHLLTGYNDTQNGGTTIRFVNLCACISFVVSGEFDGYIFKGNAGETVGYSTYTVRFNNNKTDKKRYYAYSSSESWCDNTAGPQTQISVSDWTGADNATVNKIYIPYGDGGSLAFTSGFTIQFLKGGSIVKELSTNSSVNLSADKSDDKYKAKYLPLGNITSKLKDYVAPTEHDSSIDMTGATDLSSSKSANCYIVDGSDDDNAGKVFTFKAYKGNSTSGVGTIASTAILWETYNNAEDVTANTVIADIDYDKQTANDYYTIVFQMPASLHPGNAVIAAKNAGGDILWSWHIWVPETSITNAAYGGIFGKNALDRNLGALVAATGSDSAAETQKSYGFFYQWGRKDPFLGAQATSSTSKATTSVAFESKSTVPITVAQSIKHPTQFAYNAETAVDPTWDGQNWNSEGISTLWNDSGNKGLYDPCPPGYRVPVYSDKIGFWKSDDWVFDTTHFWYKKEGAIFPYAGYMDDCGGGLNYPSIRNKVWGADEASTKSGYCIYIKAASYSATSTHKAGGASVRCVAE